MPPFIGYRVEYIVRIYSSYVYISPFSKKKKENETKNISSITY
jgi:hypothetical protein